MNQYNAKEEETQRLVKEWREQMEDALCERDKVRIILLHSSIIKFRALVD